MRCLTSYILSPSRGMAHLTYEDRKLIEEYRIRKKGSRAIANLLQKNHSVIGRELSRNSGGRFPYSADRAHLAYERRLKGKRVKKLDQYPLLKQLVIDRLHQGHSPDGIAGRLKNYEHRRYEGLSVSHETIYQFVYSGEGRALDLPQHLYSHQAKRDHQKRVTGKRVLIPNRTSIHERPKAVEKRKQAGHWESDDMIFTNGKECLSVEQERKSRYVSLHKTKDKSAANKLRAILKTITSLPLVPFHSIAFDNGTENAQHTLLQTMHRISTFFCDPYASWQKGGIENSNRWTRRYLPRKTNLSLLSDEDIRRIQDTLNNKPRKSLNYLTPTEVLLGGAFNS